MRVRRLSGIRAVSFDGDGTLWDFDKVMRHSLREVLEELQPLDPEAAAALTIDGMIATRDRVAGELRGSGAALEAVRLEAFRRSLAEAGRPDEGLARHLNHVYLRHRFEDIELYEDVPPVLEELSERFTIGLVSNGNSYPERCGLDDVFGFVVLSDEHGFEKPDPRMFHVALERAGCDAYEMLHVGDSLEADVAGARAAGVHPVWLNREGAGNATGVPVDYEVRSLTEVLEIV